MTPAQRCDEIVRLIESVLVETRPTFGTFGSVRSERERVPSSRR
jgi:hypothetical protein